MPTILRPTEGDPTGRLERRAKKKTITMRVSGKRTRELMRIIARKSKKS